ncbi:MAG: DUF4267 domain-containing protein [Chloroflexota bacterium]|nr:DUF4267 domain-containing protein [Chloroflexota bacterium]
MLDSVPLAPTQPANRSPWRSAGVWLALVLVIYMLFNAARAVTNPLDFAASYGTPLAEGSSTAFVLVYAIRALFLALFGLALIVTMQWRALAWFALVAVVMPAGDALLVALQGGAISIVVRHALTAVLLFVTWLFLVRWNHNRHTQSA